MKPLPDEKSQLAILSSGANNHDKGVACQYLAYNATAASVPALAALLGDSILAAYARTPLEGIEDPSAAAALRDAIPNLKHLLLAGVVNSLGVKRDTASVPALQKLATDPSPEVRDAAISSLGLIATPEATATLVDLLQSSSAEIKELAAHAILKAVYVMKQQGNTDSIRPLLVAVARVYPSGYIFDAAKNQLRS